MENKKLFQLVAFSCVALSNGLIFAAVLGETNNVVYSITSKIAAFLLLVTGLFSWDISRLGPAKVSSIKYILMQYFFVRIVGNIGGPLCYFLFQRNSKKFRKLQDKYLLFCLQQNGKTAFGQDFGLANVSSRADFIKNCPVTKYADYEPYVKRIEENGEEGVTIRYPVDVIIWTSGTTGKSKKFPSNLRQRKKSGQVGSMALNNALTSQVGKTTTLKRYIFGSAIAEAKINERGLVTGSLTATFMNETYKHLFSALCTCPRAVFDVTTDTDCCYLHLLFGILFRDDVVAFFLMLGSQAYHFFRILESNWQQICDDIEVGSLWKDLKISHKTRKELEEFIKPNPALAATIRAECEKGLKDIVSRIWPHCKYILAITTGSFSCYKTLMQEKYTGDIPIISHVHGGTEGNYGLNVTPLKFPAEFVMDADSLFVEFIHESNLEEEQPETILPENGVIGENYELVITNHFMGLWRYRTGDVINLKGFWNTLPKYEFGYRQGQLLNVNWEKTPESLFFAALDKTVKQWNVSLHDYTTTEYIHWLDEQVTGNVKALDDTSRFYVVFLDISSDDGSTVLLTKTQRQVLDDSLKEVHEVYKTLRENSSIQPMKVFQVRTGTFTALREVMLSSNEMTASAQFKMPRVIKKSAYLKLLKDNLIKA